MIITVANVKGGTGKSMIAQNIAISLMAKGERVWLCDGDGQGTTGEWIEARRESGKFEDVRFSRIQGKCRDDLLALEEQGYVVVVDCGGHDSDTMRWAMSVSSHILIPFRPKRRDLKLLNDMIPTLDKILPVNPDVKARAVLNQCPTLPSQFTRIFDAKDVCEAAGLQPLNHYISTRNVFDDADEEGATVFEHVPQDIKAIKEVENVLEELING